MSVVYFSSLFGANSVYGFVVLDFVCSPRYPFRAFSKNTLLFLKRIDFCFWGYQGRRRPSLRAHSIHGFSTSAVFLQNWSVSQMLEVTTWKSNSVFASFIS